MAVELKSLYEEIRVQYDVKLHTLSCFGKRISWIHMVEGGEFAQFLHGNELVFNSGLNYSSNEWLKEFIRAMHEANAGGVIIALRGAEKFSQEVIEWCNHNNLPLFSASWKTPYIDIMRRFSEILLKNEQKETNLLTAFKNAITYPENEEMYLDHLERNGFSRELSYTVMILSCHVYDTADGNFKLAAVEKSLHFKMKKTIVYEENGNLIILAAGYQSTWLRQEARNMCEKDEHLYIGMGVTVGRVRDIYDSYRTALIAYQLTKTTIRNNFLAYDELGIYKILTNVRDEHICPAFMEEVLGKLIEYDKKHHTEYVEILYRYFENDCSTQNTARAIYCHKNTLTYKLNKIKEILGYDILANKNRVKIMTAFYIYRLGTRNF